MAPLLLSRYTSPTLKGIAGNFVRMAVPIGQVVDMPEPVEIRIAQDRPPNQNGEFTCTICALNKWVRECVSSLHGILERLENNTVENPAVDSDKVMVSNIENAETLCGDARKKICSLRHTLEEIGGNKEICKELASGDENLAILIALLQENPLAHIDSKRQA